LQDKRKLGRSAIKNSQFWMYVDYSIKSKQSLKVVGVHP